MSDVLRTVELTPDPAEPPELHPVNTNKEDTEVIEDKEDARQQINFAFLSPESLSKSQHFTPRQTGEFTSEERVDTEPD